MISSTLAGGLGIRTPAGAVDAPPLLLGFLVWG